MSLFSVIGSWGNNLKNAVVNTTKGVFQSVLISAGAIEKATPVAVGIGTGIYAGPVAGIAAGTTTGALIGALEKSPTKTVQKIASGVSSVSNFTGNLGGLIVDPSLEQAKKTVKENPVVAGLVGAGAIAGIGLGASSLIANIENTRAMKENTKATVESGLNNNAVSQVSNPIVSSPTELGNYNQTPNIINIYQTPPVTAPTTQISAPVTGSQSNTTTKKKSTNKKTKKKKKAPKKAKKKKSTKKRKVYK